MSCTFKSVSADFIVHFFQMEYKVKENTEKNVSFVDEIAESEQHNQGSAYSTKSRFECS